MDGSRLLTRALRNVIALLCGCAALHAATLSEAVQSGDQYTIRKLIETKAAINAVDSDGMTPLHWAARADDLETCFCCCARGRMRRRPHAMASLPYGWQ